MKVLLMDGLQLTQQNKSYRISVPASMTNMPSVEGLQDLKTEHDSFFEVTDISAKIPNGKGKAERYFLDYKVPMAAKSFLSIKGSNEILKLSVLNEVLKTNLPGQESQYIPLIHPANIYFLDMKTVRFLYVDNGELYKNPRPVLEQYKALVASMFTKHSFEKLQNAAIRQEILQKANNLFLIQIEKAASVEQMQQMIENRLSKVESDFFLNLHNEEKGRRKKNNMLLTFIAAGVVICMVLLILILIGGTA